MTFCVYSYSDRSVSLAYANSFISDDPDKVFNVGESCQLKWEDGLLYDSRIVLKCEFGLEQAEKKKASKFLRSPEMKALQKLPLHERQQIDAAIDEIIRRHHQPLPRSGQTKLTPKKNTGDATLAIAEGDVVQNRVTEPEPYNPANQPVMPVTISNALAHLQKERFASGVPVPGLSHEDAPGPSHEAAPGPTDPTPIRQADLHVAVENVLAHLQKESGAPGPSDTPAPTCRPSDVPAPRIPNAEQADNAQAHLHNMHKARSASTTPAPATSAPSATAFFNHTTSLQAYNNTDSHHQQGHGYYQNLIFDTNNNSTVANLRNNVHKPLTVYPYANTYNMLYNTNSNDNTPLTHEDTDLRASHSHSPSPVSHSQTYQAPTSYHYPTTQDWQMVQKRLSDLEREVASCKRARTSAAQGIDVPVIDETVFNGKTRAELMALLQNTEKSSNAIKLLMDHLFTPDEVIHCTLKGIHTKKGKSKKNGLCREKREVLESIMMERYNLSLVQIDAKMRSQIKMTRSKYSVRSDADGGDRN